MTTRIEDKVEHRQKITPAFIKNFDEEQGILTGYASVGGFADSYGDIVDPGAFKKTLKDHKGRIRLCWQHNFREPIGKPHVLKEHTRDQLPEELLQKYPKATCGLYFESKISDTAQGRDAKTLLRDGVLDEMSIGFDIYEKGEYQDEKGYNHLTDIVLYEFSLVTMAAMPAAMVTDYKMRLKPEETEDYIRLPIEGVSCEITATIDIDKDKGIKGLYCGDEKKVRTLLFAKDKGWTMETAKAWYEEHKEDFKAMEDDPLLEKSLKVSELLRGGQLPEAYILAKEMAEELSSSESIPLLGEGEALALRIRVRSAELSL